METQHDPVEDAAGEPARVSPRFLWFIGLMLALLLAGGGYVVTEHIMTSKAIEQLGRSVAHGIPPAVATRAPVAAARLVPQPAPTGAQAGMQPGVRPSAQAGMQPGMRPVAQAAVQPGVQLGGDWISGDADLAAETSGGSRAQAGAKPDGALRVSGGAEPLDGQAGGPQAAFDTAGSSSAGAAGGARAPAVREEGGRARRTRVPGYEVELEKHYSTIFARCPRPGVPGAVECRRAVCAGGARKTAACRYYADGRD